MNVFWRCEPPFATCFSRRYQRPPWLRFRDSTDCQGLSLQPNDRLVRFSVSFHRQDVSLRGGWGYANRSLTVTVHLLIECAGEAEVPRRHGGRGAVLQCRGGGQTGGRVRTRLRVGAAAAGGASRAHQAGRSAATPRRCGRVKSTTNPTRHVFGHVACGVWHVKRVDGSSHGTVLPRTVLVKHGPHVPCF